MLHQHHGSNRNHRRCRLLSMICAPTSKGCKWVWKSVCIYFLNFFLCGGCVEKLHGSLTSRRILQTVSKLDAGCYRALVRCWGGGIIVRSWEQVDWFNCSSSAIKWMRWDQSCVIYEIKSNDIFLINLNLMSKLIDWFGTNHSGRPSCSHRSIHNKFIFFYITFDLFHP